MEKNKKGILSMFLGSFNYALYPVLIALAAFSSHLYPNASLELQFLWGFTLVGIKELMNLIFQLIFMTIQKGVETKSYSALFTIYKSYKRIGKDYLTNRYGWLVVFAAVCAGPIGYSIETTGIIMAGSSIGTLLVNLLPIFVVLLTKWLFKNKKITPFMIFLISLFILIVISNGLGQYFTAPADHKSDVGIALVTGVAVAILWAIENVVMAYASKRKEMDHNDVVVIKLTSSALIVPAVFMPAVGAIAGNVKLGFENYSFLWTNMHWFPWLVGIGAVMFCARWAYFYSIKNTSTMISSLTLIVRFAWVPFLQLALFAIFDQPQKYMNWYIFMPLSILAWLVVASIVLHDTWIDKGNVYKGFRDSMLHIFDPIKKLKHNKTK